MQDTDGKIEQSRDPGREAYPDDDIAGSRLLVPVDTRDLIDAAAELARVMPLNHDDAAGRASLDHFLSFYRSWIIRELGMSDNPQLWAKRSEVLLRLMVGATTLIEAIDILARFSETVWGREPQFTLRTSGDVIVLTVNTPNTGGPAGIVRSLWPLAITLAQLDFLAGAHLEGVSARITHPPDIPAHVAKVFFRAPIAFDASDTSLLIPKAELARGVAVRASDIPVFMNELTEATVHAHHTPQMQTLLTNLVWNEIFRGDSADMGMAGLAKRLRLSVATIRRRLRVEGTTFKAVKEQVFDQIAKMWLREGERTVSRIAEDIGYSDAHAFRRAFRRRNGIAPRTYRHKAKSGFGFGESPRCERDDCS